MDEQVLSDLLVGEGEEEEEEIKEVIRVKVVLTEKGALRLLSMFGNQDDHDDMNELRAMIGGIVERRRSNQESPWRWAPALESIPEI